MEDPGIAIFDSVIDDSLDFQEHFYYVNSNGGQIGRIKWSNLNGTFNWSNCWKTVQIMTENQMRNFRAPFFGDLKKLMEFIGSFSRAKYSYGTCVYGVSITSEAVFNYMAGTQGITGFMASAADLDIIRRTRCLEHPFSLVTIENYLYPQYSFRHDELKEKMEEYAAKVALNNLNDDVKAHPEVIKHWVSLVDRYIPESEQHKE